MKHLRNCKNGSTTAGYEEFSSALKENSPKTPSSFKPQSDPETIPSDENSNTGGGTIVLIYYL